MRLMGFICLMAFPLWSAENSESELKKLFPEWESEGLVECDLDKDGKNDIAVIQSLKRDEEVKDARLRVFFRDSQAKLIEKLSLAKTPCVGCGGVKGAEIPFTLECKKGALQLTYEGGSREMFSQITTWRWQKNDFYLIGVTYTEYDSLAQRKGQIEIITRDANISTLKMDEKIEKLTKDRAEDDEKGGDTVTSVTKCAVPAKFKEVLLKNFDAQNFDIPQCSKIHVE